MLFVVLLDRLLLVVLLLLEDMKQLVLHLELYLPMLLPLRLVLIMVLVLDQEVKLNSNPEPLE